LVLGLLAVRGTRIHASALKRLGDTVDGATLGPEMSLLVRIMVAKAGRPPWTMERRADMTNHNGVLMMQRLLLAGTLGLAVAQKAAAILDGGPATADPTAPEAPMPDALLPLRADGQLGQGQLGQGQQADGQQADGQQGPEARGNDGAVLRAILDAANECLGHFDDRPPAERWCDTLLQVLDLAAFAADLDSAANSAGNPAGNSPSANPASANPADDAANAAQLAG
jgi:hypothetical protein